MISLTPGTYADLIAGRRLMVALPRCSSCVPEKPHLMTPHALDRHNLRVAETGERSYAVRRAA